MTEEKYIPVTLYEKVKLKEINQRANIQNLELGDMLLSVAVKIKCLSKDTSIEELKEMQNQLRAMLNKVESDIKITKSDKEFLEELQKRAPV